MIGFELITGICSYIKPKRDRFRDEQLIRTDKVIRIRGGAGEALSALAPTTPSVDICRTSNLRTMPLPTCCCSGTTTSMKIHDRKPLFHFHLPLNLKSLYFTSYLIVNVTETKLFFFVIK